MAYGLAWKWSDCEQDSQEAEVQINDKEACRKKTVDSSGALEASITIFAYRSQRTQNGMEARGGGE
jgi:hypothetical protein